MIGLITVIKRGFINSKMKIYKGSEHPHEAQNPKEISLLKENNKNILRS